MRSHPETDQEMHLLGAALICGTYIIMTHILSFCEHGLHKMVLIEELMHLEMI